MRNLIIGGEGYIGLHLQKILKADVIDIQGNPNYRIDIRSNFSFIKEYDNVIYLAAKVKVNESNKEPYEYFKSNVYALMNVLEKIKTKNFIFASSGTAAQPDSIYGLTKNIGEKIVQDYCLKNGINYTIFRFYNVIGSLFGIKPTNPDGLFYNLIKASYTGEFDLYGINYPTRDGSAVRDYIHVMEVCYAIQKATMIPAMGIESLGTGHGYTVLEVIQAFKKSNKVDFKINIKEARDGDLAVSVLDKVSSYYTQLYSLEELLLYKGEI